MKAVISKGKALACAVALALCALVAVPGFAFAGATGSISLVCAHERDGVSTPVAGDTYAVVAVASASIQDGAITYDTLPAFAEVSCDWRALDAAGWRRQAQVVHEVFARDALAPQAVVVTDDAGHGRASGLAAGLYLVARIEAASDNAGLLVDPALVSVPVTVDGGLAYEVTVYSKFEDAPGPGGGGPGGLFPGFDLPTTGDVQLALVGLLLLLGTATLWSTQRVSDGGASPRS